MRSKSIRSSAPPALRIPTFDSMRRFSTVSTEYAYEHTGSEIELPTFTFGLDEGPPLILPNYLIDQIDAGSGIEPDRKTENASEIDWNARSRVQEVLSGGFDHASKVNGIDGTFTNSSPFGDPDLHLHPQANSNARSNIKTTINHYTRHRSGPFQPQPRPTSQITTHTVDSVGVTALPALTSRGMSDTHHARFEIDATAKMLSTPSKAEKRHKRRGSMMVLGEMLGALGLSLGKKSVGSEKGRDSSGKNEGERGNEAKLKEGRMKRTGSTLSCMALGGSPSSETDPASSSLASEATQTGSSGCHGGREPFTPSPPFTHMTTPSSTSTTSRSDTRTHARKNCLKTNFVPVYPPSSAYSPNTPIPTRRPTTYSKAEPTPKPTHPTSSSTSISTNLLSSADPNTPFPQQQYHHCRSPGAPLLLADLNHDINTDTTLNADPNTNTNPNPSPNPRLPSPLDTNALQALQEIIQNLHAENQRLRARLGVWKV